MKTKVAHLIAVAGWGVAACAYLEAWHQRQRAEALGDRLLQELHHPAARSQIQAMRELARNVEDGISNVEDGINRSTWRYRQ